MKRLLIIFTLAVTVIYFYGNGAVPTIRSGEEKVWREGVESLPTVLDPHFFDDEVGKGIVGQIFQTLVEKDSKGSVLPAAAKGWTVCPEGIKYTFYLRDNIRFHKTVRDIETANGGRRVTAFDWVYSFNRLADPRVNSPYHYLLENIEGYSQYRMGNSSGIYGIKAKDKYTLEITLSKPFAPLINILSMVQLSVLPKEDVEMLKEHFAIYPVGSGPFVLQDIADDFIALNKNDNYWERRWGRRVPFLDRVEFIKIDKNLGEKMYQSRQINAIPFNWGMGGNIIRERGNRICLLAFSIGRPSTEINVKIRKLVSQLIDREDLVDEKKEPIYWISEWWENKGPRAETIFDVEEIREQLLEIAPGGIRITYTYPTDQGHWEMAEKLITQLARGEIHLRIKHIGWRNFIDSVERQQEGFFPVIWELPYNDPHTVYYNLFHSSKAGLTNWIHLKDNQIDLLIEEALKESDWEKRLSIYRNIDNLLADKAVIIPLFTNLTGIRYMGYNGVYSDGERIVLKYAIDIKIH